MGQIAVEPSDDWVGAVVSQTLTLRTEQVICPYGAVREWLP
jgi:hypothetical protein